MKLESTRNVNVDLCINERNKRRIAALSIVKFLRALLKCYYTSQNVTEQLTIYDRMCIYTIIGLSVGCFCSKC